MYTISNDYVYETIIKNSRFITILKKIDEFTNIENIFNDIKKEYPDATHYCYAYVTDKQKKSSDDGEPTGTAGIPILKVIEANNLINVLVVVVRYFGGIKLGANGLIRAYTKCSANIIKEVNLLKLENGINIDITFNYDRIKEIDYLLKDIKVNTKTFDENIIYNISIPLSFLEVIESNNIKYTINKYIKIEV